MDKYNPTDPLKFNRKGELQSILLGCKSDEEQKIFKKALDRLVQPRLRDRIARFFSLRG